MKKKEGLIFESEEMRQLRLLSKLELALQDANAQNDICARNGLSYRATFAIRISPGQAEMLIKLLQLPEPVAAVITEDVRVVRWSPSRRNVLCAFLRGDFSDADVAAQLNIASKDVSNIRRAFCSSGFLTPIQIRLRGRRREMVWTITERGRAIAKEWV